MLMDSIHKIQKVWDVRTFVSSDYFLPAVGTAHQVTLVSCFTTVLFAQVYPHPSQGGWEDEFPFP